MPKECLRCKVDTIVTETRAKLKEHLRIVGVSGDEMHASHKIAEEAIREFLLARKESGLNNGRLPSMTRIVREGKLHPLRMKAKRASGRAAAAMADHEIKMGACRRALGECRQSANEVQRLMTLPSYLRNKVAILLFAVPCIFADFGLIALIVRSWKEDDIQLHVPGEGLYHLTRVHRRIERRESWSWQVLLLCCEQGVTEQQTLCGWTDWYLLLALRIKLLRAMVLRGQTVFISLFSASSVLHAQLPCTALLYQPLSFVLSASMVTYSNQP